MGSQAYIRLYVIRRSDNMRFTYICNNSLCNHEIVIHKNEVNIKEKHYITCPICKDLMSLEVSDEEDIHNNEESLPN